MIELYQAEWCPYSSRVRQRFTELGVSFVARPVPADPADREEMRRKTGSDERTDADAHRERAAQGTGGS